MQEHERTEVSSKKNNLPGKLSKWVIVSSGSCAIANPEYPRNASAAHNRAAVLRQNAMVDEYVSVVRYETYERYSSDLSEKGEGCGLICHDPTGSFHYAAVFATASTLPLAGRSQ